MAGYDVVDESLEVRKRVGYLPETVPLYSDMTAFEYLTFMADLRQTARSSQDRAFETLETGRHGQSGQQLHQQPLKGHAPEDRAGTGPDPSSGSPDPGRTDDRLWTPPRWWRSAT